MVFLKSKFNSNMMVDIKTQLVLLKNGMPSTHICHRLWQKGMHSLYDSTRNNWSKRINLLKVLMTKASSLNA